MWCVRRALIIGVKGVCVNIEYCPGGGVDNYPGAITQVCDCPGVKPECQGGKNPSTWLSRV